MNITTLKDNNIHIAIFHCPYICCKNSTSKHTETKNGTNLANKAFRSSYFFFYFGSLNLISESTTSKKVMRSLLKFFLWRGKTLYLCDETFPICVLVCF